MKITKAQEEIVRFLYGVVLNGGHAMRSEFSGGDLVDFYHARWIAKYQDGKEILGGIWPTTSRSHAFRRTGGLQLRRLADAGVLEMVGYNHGVPYYEFSEAGDELADRMHRESQA